MSKILLFAFCILCQKVFACQDFLGPLNRGWETDPYYFITVADDQVVDVPDSTWLFFSKSNQPDATATISLELPDTVTDSLNISIDCISNDNAAFFSQLSYNGQVKDFDCSTDWSIVNLTLTPAVGSSELKITVKPSHGGDDYLAIRSVSAFACTSESDDPPSVFLLFVLSLGLSTLIAAAVVVIKQLCRWHYEREHHVKLDDLN